MKKFLTVLLALSVVFTYTVGSAFAVTADGKYTSADYRNHLEKEWGTDAQPGYYLSKLKVVEEDYVKTLQFSGTVDMYSTGITAADLGLKACNLANSYPWTDAALAVYQAQIKKDIVEAKDKYISETIENVFGTDKQPVDTAPEDTAYSIGLAKVYGQTLDTVLANSIGYMQHAINPNIAKFTAAQEDSLYSAVEKKVNTVLESNYSDENANTVADEKAKTLKSIQDIKNGTVTVTDKAEAYVQAYKTFNDKVKNIPTKETEDFNNETTATTVAAAVAEYVEYALDETFGVFGLKAGTAIPAYKNVNGIDEKVYKEGYGKSVTIFGVEIKDNTKVTAAEATAVNKAYREAVIASADVVTAYANAIDGSVADKVNAVKALHSSQTSTYGCLRTINKAMNAVDMYADVVAEGKAMKETTKYGVKVYDDANVDKAVKDAEALVYADLANGYADKTAKGYIAAAAQKGGYDIYATNFEYKAFKNAIKAAQAKFYKADGTTPQTKVLYGENKTPEADYVYLKSTYATCRGDNWDVIARNACAALEIAESYAEIDKIMADAAADMSKLMLAKDEAAVCASIKSYQDALDDDNASFKDKMGLTNYLEDSFDEACADGKALIEEANTLEEVVSAYNEALSLIKGIPTKAELTAALDATIKAINALPTTTNLTLADKDAVLAALDTYMAYDAMYGSDLSKVTNTHILNTDLDAMLRLIHADLNAKVQDTLKTIRNCDPTTDKGAAALASMKGDIIALIDEIADFNNLIAEVEDVESLGLFVATTLTIDSSELESKLYAENAIWNAELHNLLAQANKANTAAEKKAVLEAYNKLTDRQKYKMEQNLKTLIEGIKADFIKAAENMKIKTSTKLYKGSKIRVKWTVKGDTSAIDGYQVYKSTKAHKNYKFMGKTPKKYMDNKKNLKKGTRYFYKVRAYVEIDGQKYYSDWSNKGNRIFKK